jgi:FkbM family methyltransferase
VLEYYPLQIHIRRLRILLNSRQYFRNWLSLGLKYFLYSKGLLRIETLNARYKDGSTFVLSPKQYALLLNGFFDDVIEDLRYEDGVAVTKDFIIPFQELFAGDSAFVVSEALKHGWKYYNGCWLKDDVKFRYMTGYILEAFEYGEYRDVDVNGKVIVDIGAGYGETAIYFLKRGARRVIAVEPCPCVYEGMLENLKLNCVEDKVAPINAAISSTHGRINVVCPHGKTAVDAITLEDIVKKFDVYRGVLKMDCEGCEYDVILNNYEYVRVFDEVYFEYHAFITKIPMDLLLKNLCKGFMCEVVSDDEFYKRHGFNKKLLGLVRCIRK